MDLDKLLLLLILLMTLIKAATGCLDARSIIPWAPLYIKRPYMTFINDPFHSTWQTRHQQSKTKLINEVVLIPTVYNISFTLSCGTCYIYSYSIFSKITINVTINEKTKEGGLFYETFPEPNKYYIGCKIYECKITNVKIKIDDPLVKRGSIICHLNRGSQHMQEIQLFQGINSVQIYEIENNECTLPVNLPVLDSVITSKTFKKNEDICYIYPIVVISSSTSSFLPQEEPQLLVYQINYTHQSNHIGCLTQERCFNIGLFLILLVINF